METRTVIAELIQIADALDAQNLIDEADQITRIAQELSSAPSFDYSEGAGPFGMTEGPDDYRADELFSAGDQFDEEQGMMMELARSEALDRLNEISQIQNPSDRDLAEYQELLNFLEPKSNDMQEFKNTLSESGVDVHGKSA